MTLVRHVIRKSSSIPYERNARLNKSSIFPYNFNPLNAIKNAYNIYKEEKVDCMGELISLVFNIIKMCACVLGAVLMTMYFLKEIKPLKEQYNNPESENYNSKKIEIDLKASWIAYITGMLCLLAITIVIFFV